MRNQAMFVVVMLMFSWLPLRGQESARTFPKGEVFGTYSYFNIGGGGLIPRQSLNGWGLGFAPNFNRYLGATVQLMGGYGRINETFPVQRTGVNVVSADIAAHGFLGGPELSHRGPRYRLFVHPLVGIVNYRLKNLQIKSGSVIVSAPELGESETSFAWGGGAGVDMRITPHVSARLMQLDYIVEKSNPIRRHYRMAVGFVGTFGGE
jgi:hypothetical protein